MSGRFYLEHQKELFVGSILFSTLVDVGLFIHFLLDPELSWQDSVGNRAIITIVALIVFIALNHLDRESTIKALTQNPDAFETHPELIGIDFKGDEKLIRHELSSRNLIVFQFQDEAGNNVILRERHIFFLILIFPWLLFGLAPDKIRVIVANYKNSSPKE